MRALSVSAYNRGCMWHVSAPHRACIGHRTGYSLHVGHERNARISGLASADFEGVFAHSYKRWRPRLFLRALRKMSCWRRRCTASRLRKAIADAIVAECRSRSPVPSAVIIPFPECADALVSLLVAMAGEMELYDSFQQVEAFATGIARFACERMRSLGHAAKLLFAMRA